MTPFKLTDELLAEIELLIESGKDEDLRSFMEELHYADIAEIANDLNEESATYLIKLLDSDKTSDVLIELDDDVRLVPEERGRLAAGDVNMPRIL